MEQVAEQEQQENGQVEADRAQLTRSAAQEMFKWSGYLHVGPGADTCVEVVTTHEDGTVTVDGECSNTDHFHAWCRVPNPYQHRQIREKALAAKARRLRTLKDPDSDAFAILDAELFDLEQDPSNVEQIIDDITASEFASEYVDAVTEVQEEEDFEYIERDQERLREIEQMPEGDRDADELASIQKQVEAYVKAIEAKVDELRAPRREALRQLPKDELVALLRDQRISEDAREAFIHDYNTWTWYAGTMVVKRGVTGRPEKRAFESVEAMRDAAPEVIAGIQEMFNALENALNQGAGGNP